jgi:Ethanolamine utilization protein EutJ (predicted chaperonin)
MGNVRIRYMDTNNGVLKSVRNFTTNTGQEVNVQLDTAAMQCSVLDAVSGVVVATASGTTNLAVLKIKAKTALASLGVSFENEIRNRGSQEISG